MIVVFSFCFKTDAKTAFELEVIEDYVHTCFKKIKNYNLIIKTDFLLHTYLYCVNTVTCHSLFQVLMSSTVSGKQLSEIKL